MKINLKINNKLFIIMVLLVYLLNFSLPTLATSNWVQVDYKLYIDTNSIRKENYLNSSYGNYYSMWLKGLNDGSKLFIDKENYYNNKVWCNLSQYYFDCSNMKLALKSDITYDLKGNILGDITLNDSQLSFSSVAPGTRGEIWYNYACIGRF